MHLPARDAELVQIMDASLAEAARRAGMGELRASNPGLATEIEDRARAWLTEHGPYFPGNLETGALGNSDEHQERFENFANEAACPALDPATGRCDVYAWRPMTCRVFGPPVRAAGEDGAEGLGHCELCFIGATSEQVAACEMPVPYALEAELLHKLGGDSETVVAFALIVQQ
jgi:Fe-S-cluster containining protein